VDHVLKNLMILKGLGQQQGNGTSGMTLTEMKAKTLNDQVGNLKGVDCQACKNKGYVAESRGDCLVMVECECMAKRRSLNRIEKSGLSGLIERYTFGAYMEEEGWQKNAKQKALEYVESGRGKWFVISGTPGTGKTHLCTAIASALMDDGHELRYMLWRNDAPRLKAMVNDRDAYEAELGKLKSVDVLYIDDFFKGGVTEADVNLAFELINERYNRQLRTIISSERGVESMLDIDEAIGSRIYERSKGFCVKMPEKNWRLR
jgi:DNA replication protein DnaC